ncbi:MAG: hypothetical protein IPK23_10765 [Rhizobiales bacterium]|nr:hypothetical protein [Hyphomicrobiales bacterium]
MRRITPRTVTSRAALEKEIEAGIVRGWHVSIGENAEERPSQWKSLSAWPATLSF